MFPCSYSLQLCKDIQEDQQKTSMIDGITDFSNSDSV